MGARNGMAFLSKLFGGGAGHDVEELARRLDVSPDDLRNMQPAYAEFTVPKRSGGTRRIAAPSPELKALQRRILRRLLRRLPVHASVTGFERGHSIVSNAAFHARRAVVVRMDVQDFFASTTAKRIRKYFQKIGWNREVADLLVRLCAHEGGLPQGAPTSPRLSNLVNFRLDTRLTALAAKHGAAFTRYADDLTFSFPEDKPSRYRAVIFGAKWILDDHGYRIHHKRKLHVRRRYDRQVVTGLVVNERVALPRETRRWLRAVEHRARTGGAPTLTPQQLAGWRALQHMIETQRDALSQ